MSIKTNAQLFALREEIAKAIKEGNLSEKMDVIKLEATALNMSEEDLTALIEEVKKDVQKQGQVQTVVKKKKNVIVWISIAIVVLEWIIGLSLYTPPREFTSNTSNLLAQTEAVYQKAAALSTTIDNSRKQADISNVQKMASDLAISAENAYNQTKELADMSENIFTVKVAIWLFCINILSILIVVIVASVLINKKIAKQD